MKGIVRSKYNLSDTCQLLNYINDFTKAYQSHQDKALREAACLNVQFPSILKDIHPEDQFAGRIEWPLLCFSPQTKAKAGIGFGYCFEKDKAEALLNDQVLSVKDKDKLSEIISYWENENSAAKTRNSFPCDMVKAFPSDNWLEDSGVAFPLYRMAGSQLNYPELLKKGVKGIKYILKKKSEVTNEPAKRNFYLAGVQSLELFSDICLFYAEQASQFGKIELAESLKYVAHSPPENFHQAIQLIHLYAIVSGSLNYGRLDDYLGPYLEQDIAKGLLNEQKALEMIKAFWRIIIARDHVHDCRVVTGGKGRKNEKSANYFALLAMEASRQIKDVLPQLTLRFYNGQDPELLSKAYECISEGVTFPMLYNDDVNIPSVTKAFKITSEEARQYIPFGCGEYMINHRSFDSPNGVINLLKALEITLHGGIDPVTNKSIGLPTEINTLQSFEDFLKAYERQVENYVDLLARQQSLEYQIAGQENSFLFLSLLYDDCIERGIALFEGGVTYLGGTLESYGNINTADSLVAIKENVFDKKQMSLSGLVKALDHDFEGFEEERNLLLKAPKYGNDDPVADEMAQKIHAHVCNYASSKAKENNLHHYLVVVINNSANAILGRKTFASADGRRSGTPMANGNNPVPGMDKTGFTAFLNSLIKLDTTIHAGTVQNMKFSREMFTRYGDKTINLLNTYFEKGGSQAMISVVNRKDLENAIKEPEKYGNLVVRVGGFSARFIELEKDVQQEILARTIY